MGRAKRRSNLKKHGVDFSDLESLSMGATVTILDDRFSYPKHRFITLGLLRGVDLIVAHTETEEVIRILSARKATRYEEESYFKEIGQ